MKPLDEIDQAIDKIIKLRVEIYEIEKQQENMWNKMFQTKYFTGQLTGERR